MIMVMTAAAMAWSCADDDDAPLDHPQVVPQTPTVDQSGIVPMLYITTADGLPITSKEVYVDATYYLDARGLKGFEGVGSASKPLPLEIRGRGHSSWKGDKKPYKLRLGDKQALLTMPKSRHWALIKPSENTVAAMLLGNIMGMAWTPRYQPVEVTLNGDYIGLYFLMETIRIAKDRVDIYEQADYEVDPKVVGGGWLVEIDNYDDDNQVVIKENSRWYMNIRYHSPENLSATQQTWLVNEFKAINAAIYSADKTSTDWEAYIDVASMARYFIIQEVIDNPDGFHGSFYLHKDQGTDAKWVAGPIWDLVCYGRDKTDYTFRMPVHYGITPHWIDEIIQYPRFCQAVAEAWRDVYPAKIDAIYADIDKVMLPLEQAWARDCQRWNDDPTQTAAARAERIKHWVESNAAWLDANLPAAGYE